MSSSNWSVTMIKSTKNHNGYNGLVICPGGKQICFFSYLELAYLAVVLTVIGTFAIRYFATH